MFFFFCWLDSMMIDTEIISVICVHFSWDEKWARLRVRAFALSMDFLNLVAFSGLVFPAIVT